MKILPWNISHFIFHIMFLIQYNGITGVHIYDSQSYSFSKKNLPLFYIAPSTLINSFQLSQQNTAFGFWALAILHFPHNLSSTHLCVIIIGSHHGHVKHGPVGGNDGGSSHPGLCPASASPLLSPCLSADAGQPSLCQISWENQARKFSQV